MKGQACRLKGRHCAALTQMCTPHFKRIIHSISLDCVCVRVCLHACVFFLFNMERRDFTIAWVWIIYDEHVALTLTVKRETAKGRLSDSLPQHIPPFFAIQPFLALQHLNQSHSSGCGGAQARPPIGCQPEAERPI